MPLTGILSRAAASAHREARETHAKVSRASTYFFLMPPSCTPALLEHP